VSPFMFPPPPMRLFEIASRPIRGTVIGSRRRGFATFEGTYRPLTLLVEVCEYGTDEISAPPTSRFAVFNHSVLTHGFQS